MKKLFITLSLFLFYSFSFSEPVKVTTVPSNSRNFTAVGNYIFFTAGDSLMKTDGTNSKVELVKSGLKFPGRLFEYNGLLYFNNDSPDAYSYYGKEIWRSDGTSAGTYLLNRSDINYIQTVINWNDFVYFTSENASTGRELYRTNGTIAGTILLKDINPGAGSGIIIPSYSAKYVGSGNLVYFLGSDPAHGTELWRTDGTVAGTILLKDVNPGTESGFKSGPWALAGSVYFGADDGTHGTELWITKGTPATTMLVKDINPGSGNGFGVATPVGTSSEVYFLAQDTLLSAQLWKTNGTSSGTVLVKDFTQLNAQYIELIYSKNNEVYFYLFYENEIDFWRSNGTLGGTEQYATINQGGDVRIIKVFDNKAYLVIYSYDTQFADLLVTDGTNQGTFAKRVLNGRDASVQFITIVDNQLLFGGNEGEGYYYEYFKSDGTYNGTYAITPILQNAAGQFTVIGNKVYFVMDLSGYYGPYDPPIVSI